MAGRGDHQQGGLMPGLATPDFDRLALGSGSLAQTV